MGGSRGPTSFSLSGPRQQDTTELASRYNSGYTLGMKTAVSIPDALFRAAEREAKRQKVSRSRLYARAVEAYLKRQEVKGVKDALDAIYATEDSSLDPVVARMQSLSVGPEEW
jgi:predicted transcriptional regulator